MRITYYIYRLYGPRVANILHNNNIIDTQNVEQCTLSNFIVANICIWTVVGLAIYIDKYINKSNDTNNNGSNSSINHNNNSIEEIE
jgi:hypothetical protein